VALGSRLRGGGESVLQAEHGAQELDELNARLLWGRVGGGVGVKAEAAAAVSCSCRQSTVLRSLTS
jgi:hypothetical protein